MPTRAERIARQAELQRVQDEVEEELRKIPGVVGVGIGFKETSGAKTGEITFRVFVREKRPLEDVPPDQVIPPEIMGIKTDVEIVPDTVGEDDTSRYRPLKPGIQIGNSKSSGVGTLGCFASFTDGSTVILSNHHVLYADGAGDGDEVGQPAYVDCCCCASNEVAVNVRGVRDGVVDAAIARVNSDIAVTRDIPGIGTIDGTGVAVVGDVVRKVGRTTGLTTGTVVDVGVPTTSDGTNFTDQIRIQTNNGNDRFSKPGDSGSVVLNEDNEIIGLHFSGRNRDTDTPPFESFSSKIANVLTRLSITIPIAPGGDESLDSREALVGDVPSDAAPVLSPSLMQQFEAALRQSAFGQTLLDTINRHYLEVINLVNRNRSVMVVWRRKQGPAFAGAFMQAAQHPDDVFPKEINGVDLQSLLRSMAVALEDQGSPQLAQVVRQYSLMIFNVAEESATLNQMFTTIRSH